MRALSPALAAHLAGDATTLCHCWRVIRSDGVILGFTEHDRDLAFDGTDFRAASGFRASEADAENGLAAPASEVAGGFSSEAITPADLAAGRYDGARVEVFLVNWQAPDERVLLKVQEIGEVTRSGGQFTAELRSFAHKLSQERGRIYNRRCDAVLGDARCGVDLSGYRGEGSVISVGSVEGITVAGLGAFPDGFFAQGVLTFLTGENIGRSLDVETCAPVAGGTAVSFWLPMETLPAAGDLFEITAGCDKAFATCRTKFGNHLNFRGFPHMPGSDFAYSYADGETTHDGRPLYE